MADGEFSFERVELTPHMAKEFLKRNTDNFRRLDAARVDHYAKDMRNGVFRFNGDSIKFDREGLLIDGQHRLAAVVKSNTSIDTIIVRGVEPESALTIDDGKPRQASDWLRHKHVKNANNIAAISRYCLIAKRGLWKNQSVGKGYITRSDIIQYALQHNDNLQGAYKLAASGKRYLPASFLGALTYIAVGERCNPADNTTVSWFCRGLATGLDLCDTDAVYHLRQRLTTTHHAQKLNPYLQRMLMTLAWNKTAEGETTRQLKFALTGPTRSKPINTIAIAPE